jgi:hypothetical protein
MATVIFSLACARTSTALLLRARTMRWLTSEAAWMPLARPCTGARPWLQPANAEARPVSERAAAGLGLQAPLPDELLLLLNALWRANDCCIAAAAWWWCGMRWVRGSVGVAA